MHLQHATHSMKLKYFPDMNALYIEHSASTAVIERACRKVRIAPRELQAMTAQAA